MKIKYLTIFLAICLLGTFHLAAQRSFGGQPYDEEQLGVATKCFHASAIELPPVNTDSLLRDDAQYGGHHGALRFAHKISVNIHPDNSGETFYTADGTKVWRVKIHSQNAYSLNVIFDTFRIPQGARLFVYNPEKTHVAGSFTHLNEQDSGEFPIAPVPGDEIIIEYQEPANAEFEGDLQIYEVNHDYRGLRIGGKFQYLDMPCLPHLSCQPDLENWGRSVCLLILNGDTYCTGTFVNNTRQDGKAYILTAAHCLNNNPELGSRSVVFLNYESPRCMAEIQASEEFSLTSCQTRALSNEADFALLELDSLPPADYRPILAGWNLDSQLNDHAPFTCIHHPYGEGKRFATEQDKVLAASWPFGEGIAKHNHWRVGIWEEGHTWAGSSGSALFDKNGLVVGSLSGGDSGGNSGCSDYYYGDYFTQLHRAWDQFEAPDQQLKHWLDPDNTGQTSLEAYDPWKKEAPQRVSHIAPDDEISVFKHDDYGYLFGSNNQNIKAYAEHFELDEPRAIYGVYLMPYIGHLSTTAPVKISIATQARPNKKLAEKEFRPSYTEYRSHFQTADKKEWSHKENYVRWDSCVYLDEDFLVRIELDDVESEKNTFAMYAAATADNHAYYFSKKWQSFEQSPWAEQAYSMWIEPMMGLADSSKIQQYEASMQGFEYFYHPAERSLHFSCPEHWPEAFKVMLFDLQGRCLLQRELNKDESLDMSKHLADGVYIVHIQNAAQKISFKLFL